MIPNKTLATETLMSKYYNKIMDFLYEKSIYIVEGKKYIMFILKYLNNAILYDNENGWYPQVNLLLGKCYKSKKTDPK